MIKTHIFLRAKAGVKASGSPFATQGMAAAQSVERLLPEARGYVQSVSLDSQAEYQGVAEFWFLDYQSAPNSAGELTSLAKLWRDDVSVSSVVTGMQRTVIRLPSDYSVMSIKGVFPFRRKQGMSVPDFQHHWWRRHGPIAAHTENALHYTQTHPLPEVYEAGTPEYDGVTELSWATRELADAAMNSRQMRQDQANDADRFVDKDSIRLFFVSSEVVIAP